MKGDKNEQHKWSPKNLSVLDADDWEVACVGGVAGGVGGGGGALWFRFRSVSLEQYLNFSFVGGGAAAGLVGGWEPDPTVTEYDCSRVDWISLRSAIKEPFSASNLCNAVGRVSVLSIATPGDWAKGLGFGYTHYVLTAVYNGPNRSGFLFDKFEFGGVGLGTGGIGAGVLWGKWIFTGIPPKLDVTNNNWTKPACQ